MITATTAVSYRRPFLVAAEFSSRMILSMTFTSVASSGRKTEGIYVFQSDNEVISDKFRN